VTGPAAIFLTTTATDVDEELLNRCLVLTVDEGREQTRAIHDRQRAAQTLDGLLAGAEAEGVRRLHQDAQRLLESLAVVNPHARSLGFADGTVRTRRDHVKYLTLIAAVTLLHQHQRPVRTAARGEAVIRYVESTPADIALADRLAAEVLAQSLDELPPGTRRLLDAIAGYVTARSRAEGTDPGLVRFTRRQLREALPLGDSQLKFHLARLADYELVIARRAGQGGGFSYELAWQPESVTAGGGDAAMTPDRPGPEGSRPGPGRGPAGGQPGSGRVTPEAVNGQATGHEGVSGDGHGPGSTDPGRINGRVVVTAAGGAR
jgi:DNA primase